MSVREKIRKALPSGFPRWAVIVALIIVVVIGLFLIIGGTYSWEYANSPKFCGYTCHTMIPQNTTYQVSPHSNVYCSDCHIGRASFVQQISRKSQDLRELYAMIFHTYEYPLQAVHQRPASITCEKCHRPNTFSFDSMRTIRSYGDDRENTALDTYLILKTGGGKKTEGLGRGIHWHLDNRVAFYATDELQQDIPYVVAYNEDGSKTVYVDIEAGIDTSTISEDDLVEVDCMTCHNRVSHRFLTPEDAVDNYLARGLLDDELPDIRRKGVEMLSGNYESTDVALTAIAGLEGYYTQYYPNENIESVQAAVATLQEIYTQNFFPEHKTDWTTHPDNIGHINSPGCFRCHDGKHLDNNQESIRLECNICHSIPVNADDQDFVANIEISRGPEPDSHRNSNWIALHHLAFDSTCETCHTVEDPGGVSNTSFCSNSACHSSVFTYAGFDAPALREALAPLIPTPAPTPTPIAVDETATLTYEKDIQPIFEAHCYSCHSDSAMGGLTLSTYDDLMAGGKNGPVIVPGDSVNSLLVQIQEGQHFAKLSKDELTLVKLWIDGGALEK